MAVKHDSLILFAKW